MNKDFFKKNRFTILALVFFVLCFILLLEAKSLFFPSDGSVGYGDRLNGIVKIEENAKTDLVSKLKEDSSVLDASIEVKGAIINVFITVNDDVDVNKAKTIGETSKSGFTEEVLGDYDIQVFVSKNNPELNNFPIIGYKNKNIEGFSWTKDREITSTSVGE